MHLDRRVVAKQVIAVYEKVASKKARSQETHLVLEGKGIHGKS